jgi:hypothetical protein
MITIDKDILYKLYIEENLSDQKIADKLNLKRRDVSRLRVLHGIKSLEDYERHPYQILTDEEKQIITGSILGDGHIRRRYQSKIGEGKSYPQLMFAQSTKHEEYFYWFKEKMKRWVYDTERPIKIRVNKNPLYKSPALSLNMQTICHPVFNEFYEGFYIESGKIVNFDLLEKYFTDLTLAIWHMDDGGVTGNQKRIRLCTNGFTLQEVEGLSNFLLKKYGFKVWVTNSKTKHKMTHELHFDKASGEKMSYLIKDIVVPSMQYKLLLPE